VVVVYFLNIMVMCYLLYTAMMKVGQKS